MNTNYFTSCKTAEELKQAYKQLARKLHPDCNHDRDTTAEFQRMQAEYESAWERLKDCHVNKDGEFYTASTPTEETAADFMNIINELLKYSEITVELCGSWLWVYGNTKPIKAVLNKFKFRWSSNKAAWYFHFGGYKKFSKKPVSLERIREMYGSEVFNRNPDFTPDLV